MGETLNLCLFGIKKRLQAGGQMLLPLYCMDSLVAWEALSILLPMASTSFPIPLMVLQEARRRASEGRVWYSSVEERLKAASYPASGSLSMSRMLSGTPLFPGMGLSGGEESGCAEPGFGSYVKNLRRGPGGGLLMKAAGPSFTGGIAAWTAAGRRGFFPLG